MKLQKNNIQQKLSDKSSIEKQYHIVLAGQPNCGKSTLFNEVAGYQSIASNFPGATVSYTESHLQFHHNTLHLIDLPGVYSLTSLDPAASESQKYLLKQPVDVLVNVIDASILSRSLELTLQLMALEIPMVICLNMMDEAERKGLQIDIQKLSDILGMPVVKTVASRGIGLQNLFHHVIRSVNDKHTASQLPLNKDVEEVVADLALKLPQVKKKIQVPDRLLAMKLIEDDEDYQNILEPDSQFQTSLKDAQHQLESSHGRSADEVINLERHGIAMSIFEKVCQFQKPKIHWKDKIDSVLMHPILGYVFLTAILFGFFWSVFKFGTLLEGPLLTIFTNFTQDLSLQIQGNSLWETLLISMLDGLGGGIAIAIPYLIPFLIGLSLLEDIGYLPRVAFLMDGFMHRIGLHGTAVIPAVLGYGCNVPAIMATRIMDSPRDRLIASLIAVMVPCAGKMTVIFGLVGYYMGGPAAFGIYLLNLIVIALSAGLLSRLLPVVTPGMVLEIPSYQAPKLNIIIRKTWLRLKEFIIIAWPLLIVGSIILSLINHYEWTFFVDSLTRPVTYLLGLPKAVGTTLIFGVLRKELTLLMLSQALGVRDILSVMSYWQMLVFTVFVVFYIPCVAAIGTLYKQVRLKGTVLITLFTFILALALAMLVRLFSLPFH